MYLLSKFQYMANGNLGERNKTVGKIFCVFQKVDLNQENRLFMFIFEKRYYNKTQY